MSACPRSSVYTLRHATALTHRGGHQGRQLDPNSLHQGSKEHCTIADKGRVLSENKNHLKTRDPVCNATFHRCYPILDTWPTLSLLLLGLLRRRLLGRGGRGRSSGLLGLVALLLRPLRPLLLGRIVEAAQLEGVVILSKVRTVSQSRNISGKFKMTNPGLQYCNFYSFRLPPDRIPVRPSPRTTLAPPPRAWGTSTRPSGQDPSPWDPCG